MKKTKVKKVSKTNGKAVSTNGVAAKKKRLEVQKTYKLFIGGKFPRTESGRYIKVKGTNGDHIANVCRGSRKDFRNSVVAARKAQAAWAGRSAYNRGQILYRMAEMLEGRMPQFVEEQKLLGRTDAEAKADIAAAIDRLIYYAGWTDKYQQIFSSVNPVSSSHFNFSILEPMGVVAAFAPSDDGLLGLVSVIAPVIGGGNSIIILASEKQPMNAMTFAEVLQTSDLPGGVVNILTGHQSELAGHFSSHMDVNGMVYCGNDKKALALIKENGQKNVKRVIHWHHKDWRKEKAQGPYYISDCQETKTTWHPIGI